MKGWIIGQKAEKKALAWLKKQGLRLVERRFNCPWGEIDLIMWDGPILVFVEVRYRRSAAYGTALDSIDRIKQSKLIRTADYYLQKNKIHSPCRFDCVAMQGDQKIEWIKNAIVQ